MENQRMIEGASVNDIMISNLVNYQSSVVSASAPHTTWDHPHKKGGCGSIPFCSPLLLVLLAVTCSLATIPSKVNAVI